MPAAGRRQTKSTTDVVIERSQTEQPLGGEDRFHGMISSSSLSGRFGRAGDTEIVSFITDSVAPFIVCHAHLPENEPLPSY